MAHVKVRKEHNANPHNNTDNHRPHDMLFPLKLRRFPEQDYDSGDRRHRCHDQKHLLYLGEIYVQHGYHILTVRRSIAANGDDTIAKYHKFAKPQISQTILISTIPNTRFLKNSANNKVKNMMEVLYKNTIGEDTINFTPSTSDRLPNISIRSSRPNAIRKHRAIHV